MSKVLIAIDKSKSYRVYLTITTKIVEEARKLHNTSPLGTAGLGRVLTGTGLMSIMLKNPQDRLTVIFKGDGPAKQILAVGNGDGEIKGYIASPQVDMPLTERGKLDVGGSLGIGDLTIIKDLGLKEPYSGNIALVSGEIAEDLTAYYYISEQQNTSISLGVKIGKDLETLAAGGLFIQMLPGNEEDAILELESLTSSMLPITTEIERVEDRIKHEIGSSGEKNEDGEDESEKKALEYMLQSIFQNVSPEFKPEILEFRDIELMCDCSKERMEQALMTIGREELATILEQDGMAELSCQFCGNRYSFNEEQLGELIAQMEAQAN